MKTKMIISAVLVSMLLTPLSALAEKVKVNWFEPNSYTDVKPVNGGKERYRTKVFKQLEQHFEKEAQKVLPDQLSLRIKVLDLNLAGDVTFNVGMNQEIRYIKPIHWPVIEFEYELLENGNVVKSEAVTLRDMAFMDRLSNRSSSTLKYEKHLISDWFYKDIKAMLAQLDKRKTAVMS